MSLAVFRAFEAVSGFVFDPDLNIASSVFLFLSQLSWNNSV